MLRMMLIKKYVNTSDIQSTIGHSPVVYLKEAFVMIVLLFVLYVIFALLNHTSPAPYWQWIFGGVWLLLFIKWMVDFLTYIWIVWFCLRILWLYFFGRGDWSIKLRFSLGIKLIRFLPLRMVFGIKFGGKEILW